MTTQSPEPIDLGPLALTPLMPDRIRAERTRRRCGTTLSARIRRRHRRADLRARAFDTLTPVIVVACGLFYAATLVANTLRLEALLR